MNNDSEQTWTFIPAAEATAIAAALVIQNYGSIQEAPGDALVTLAKAAHEDSLIRYSGETSPQQIKNLLAGLNFRSNGDHVEVFRLGH